MEKTTFEQRLTCRDCRFSDKIAGSTIDPLTGLGADQITICRLKPPVIAYGIIQTKDGAQIMSQPIWPTMASIDWCGSLEPRTS